MNPKGLNKDSNCSLMRQLDTRASWPDLIMVTGKLAPVAGSVHLLSG